jgi:hypothetical protein
MTLLLTIGSPHSTAAQVGELLLQGGVAAPQASGASASPAVLQRTVMRMLDIDPARSGQLAQVTPGTDAQRDAASFLGAHRELPLWGWADPFSLLFMDFWLAAEPGARILMTYSDPAQELVRSFKASEGDAPSLAAVLDTWYQWNDALLRYRFRHLDRTLLVNGDAALAEPGKLLNLLSNAIGNNSMRQPNAHPVTPSVADRLLLQAAQTAVSARDDVQKLLRELQEAAQLPGGFEATRTPEPAALWAAACDLVRNAAQARDAAASSTKTIEALRGEVAGAKGEMERLAGTCEDLRAACARATSERTHQEQLANERFVQVATLDTRVAELQTLVAQQPELEALKQRLGQQSGELRAVEAELAALREDKELVELQLLQVQEELTHYFQAWKDERTRPAPDPAGDILGRFWRSQQPQTLALDLRRPIAGEQWYDAEPDGRWSGPAPESTLQFPPMQPGRYLLEMDVMDALDSAIVADAEVEVQGRRHSLNIEYFGGEGRFPALCATQIEIQRGAAAEPLLLKLHLPKTLSPRSLGGDDERELGLRLQQVRLILEQGT